MKRFHPLGGLGGLAALTAVAVGGLVPELSADAASTTGYDISWPQCTSNGANTPRASAFGIVGVNDGIAWSQNPCLTAEFTWAAGLAGAPALYMNTADPGTQSKHWGLTDGPDAKSCDPTNTDINSSAFAACAYDYGWDTAQDALKVEAANVSNAASYTWWLDVETTNTWAGSTSANAADVQGSIDYLRQTAGIRRVGVYSTAAQWNTITGSYAFPTFTPEWLAGASSAHEAQSFCTTQTPFGGANSTITLTQYHSAGFDADHPC
jgi:hypothetical protein